MAICSSAVRQIRDHSVVCHLLISIWSLLLMLAFHSVQAASISDSNSANVNIPDNGDWVYSRIDISDAPAGAIVTSVEVYFRVQHPYSGDIQVDLEVGEYANSARLWDNEGGSADNPTRTVTIDAFNGLPVNNSWWLYARDTEAQDSGFIDEWEITIFYELSSNDPPNSFSKVSPSNDLGLTSYAVTFDWNSASDPDGDAVTYNLVVNDASGNSVSNCSVEGISSSSYNCNLPQQPNQHYYWQVWAVDSQGNVREATGGFWHLWTDTTASNDPPSSFSKVLPSNDMGLTSYAVTFDWNSASDPDGDTVTYNLVVNDATGNSVSNCSVEGISSSSYNCTLPQQPNQHYYWQVWAVDSQGNVREATGGFWHVWTDTSDQQIDTHMLWKNAVHADDARITQLYGEKYINRDTGIEWTHTGVDIANGTCGSTSGDDATNVYPVLPGTVEKVFSDGIGPGVYLGNAIMIKHGPSLFSLYAHMTAPSERLVNTPVGLNDDLGTIDRTGLDQEVGCHLHLEVRDFNTVYHPQAPVSNIYLPAGYQRNEFLLEHWIDPVSPRVGQFAPGGPTPSGFISSMYVPGWDVSSAGEDSVGYSLPFARAYPFYRDSILLPNGKNPGVPFDNGGGEYVHCWSAPGFNPDCDNGVWVQDLRRSRPTFQLYPDGKSTLILNLDLAEVFLLKEGFWSFYMNHDGFQNLGAPESEEEQYTGAPNFNDPAVVQRFQNGVLYYHPDVQFDRTPPSSDRITLLQVDMTTPVTATQAWHILGSSGESFDVYQNGNFLCRAPCTEVFSVDGWRYTLTAPGVSITGVTASQIPLGPMKGSVQSRAIAGGNATLHDEHNFSFTASPGGGVVMLQTDPEFIFSDGFE